ncbi:Hypothetical predicted protein, partial [Marmota monax]
DEWRCDGRMRTATCWNTLKPLGVQRASSGLAAVRSRPQARHAPCAHYIQPLDMLVTGDPHTHNPASCISRPLCPLHPEASVGHQSSAIVPPAAALWASALTEQL